MTEYEAPVKRRERRAAREWWAAATEDEQRKVLMEAKYGEGVHTTGAHGYWGYLSLKSPSQTERRPRQSTSDSSMGCTPESSFTLRSPSTT